MRFGRDARSRNPYLAVFDIGATSVGVGIAHMSNGVTTVLWSVRTEYSYQAYDDYTRYERAMYSTLLEVGMKLTSEGVRSVRSTRPDFAVQRMDVVCVLEAPWFWGAVGTAEVSKEKAFTTTPEVLKSLEEMAHQNVRAVLEGHSWHDVVGESEVLEQERQQLTVNGYIVTQPDHAHVTSVASNTYIALVGCTVRKQITQIIERVLPSHDIRLTTSTHLLASYYRTTVGDGTGHRLFMIEVEGRITSIAHIAGGIITRISTLPLGTNHILQAAAPDALSTEEARGKLLVVYKNQDTDPSTPIPEPIQNACEAWREAVLAECAQLCEGVVPPDHVLLMVGKRWNRVLIPVLTKPWRMPGIRQERTFTVTPFLEFVAQPVPKGEPSEENQTFDSRLRLFTHALFYSTPK